MKEKFLILAGSIEGGKLPSPGLRITDQETGETLRALTGAFVVEEEMVTRLELIVAAVEDREKAGALERLFAKVDLRGHGFIEFFGYHAEAGGWFVGGWSSHGWAADQMPTAALMTFDDGEVSGAAVAALYERYHLPDGAFGVVFFAAAPFSALGNLRSLTFEMANWQTKLWPIQNLPKLREAELTTRLRSNLQQGMDELVSYRLLKMLNRQPYAGADTMANIAPSIFIYVDEAIICEPDGLVLIGWCLARASEIHEIRLRCGNFKTTLNIAEWVRIEREDVLAEFAKYGFDDANCGFVAFVPGGISNFEKLYLQVETAKGDIGYGNIPRPARTGLGAIRHLLGCVDVRTGDVQRAYDLVLGPAVAALNRVRLSLPTSTRILEYGDMPRQPRFSVIIPLYGRLDFVEYQLALFSAHPQCAEIEFVFVLDDPPKAKHARQLFPSIYARFGIPFRVVMLDRNVGFAPANNIGLQHVNGTYVCFLNSDVFPGTLDWLERLSERLIDDPSLGAIGPLLLYEDGSIQHRGMFFERLAELGNWFFCHHYDKGLKYLGDGGIQRFRCITGACVLMQTELAMQLGGFDETYVIGDFEDSDLCMRLGERGLGCAVDSGVTLFHLERKSQNFTAHNWRLNLTAYNAWQHDVKMPAKVLLVDGNTLISLAQTGLAAYPPEGTIMEFVKHYIMVAKAGEESALAEALQALKGKVVLLEGCEEVVLLRDLDRPQRFVFMERWSSAEAHKAGGAVLGKGALAPVMAAVGEPPQAMSLAAG